jgi:hypothetical protein
MNYLTREITREYRLDFNNGETHWNDPMPPDVTSGVLGKPTICIIDRTSLLAWSLMMNVREVAVADLTAGGWMKISITIGSNFDEANFTREVADTVTSVTQVPRHHGEKLLSHRSRAMPRALGFAAPAPRAGANVPLPNTL